MADQPVYQCCSCRKMITDARPGIVMCLSCNTIQPTENAMPPVEVKCACGAAFKASASLKGRRFACRKCGSPLTVKA